MSEEFKPYRTKNQIIASMLTSVIEERHNKTWLMYEAKLSFSQLKVYLSILLANKLISSSGTDAHGKETYTTSKKGREYLELCHSMESYTNQKS